MCSEVKILVKHGPLPPESASAEEIQHIQGIIQGITKPLTLEESVALARLLGNDYCFGLAWTVIHLIETAPAWDAAHVPSGFGLLLQTLRERANNSTIGAPHKSVGA